MDERPNVAGTPTWLRPFYLAAGLLALGVGIAGIFLPLVPTVGPLLFAVWCFSRSSERLHRWLVGHPRMGGIIAPFRSGATITRRAKVGVLALMTASFGASLVWLLDGTATRLALGAAAVVAFAAVLRLPTVPRGKAGEG